MNDSASDSDCALSRILEKSAPDRRSGLSYDDFLSEYVLQRKPVIIADATAGWRAADWTPEWFRERYPGKLLPTDDGAMTMDEFVDRMTGGGPDGPLLREQPLKDVFPDIVDHVLPTPAYALPNWLGTNYLVPPINSKLNAEAHIQVNFCGRRRFPHLHVDALGTHAFITQHYGEKEFIAFPPDQEPHLYRIPGQRLSEIDNAFDPDLTRFPRFAAARGMRFVVARGESLFVPCGWWHTTFVPVGSLSTVIQISNAHNWPDLVKYVETYSSHRRLGQMSGAYLRVFGAVRALLSS